MGCEERSPASARAAAWSVVLAKLCLLVAIVLLANIGASRLIESLEVQIWPEHMEIVDRVVLVGVALYIAMMATPFLPGIELGLLLMTLLGPKGVVVTYACTLIALSISFGLGRVFPVGYLVALVEWLHLQRAAALLKRFDATPPAERLGFIAEIAPAKAVPVLLRHRYLMLALLLNIPGNAVIGGGGGIAMMAGMSRLYSFPAFLALLALAVLPGPALVMLTRLVGS